MDLLDASPCLNGHPKPALPLGRCRGGQRIHGSCVQLGTPHNLGGLHWDLGSEPGWGSLQILHLWAHSQATCPQIQTFLEFSVTVLPSAHGTTHISYVGTQDPLSASLFLLCALNSRLHSALSLVEARSPQFAPLSASLTPAASLYLSQGFHIQCLVPTDPTPPYQAPEGPGLTDRSAPRRQPWTSTPARPQHASPPTPRPGFSAHLSTVYP